MSSKRAPAGTKLAWAAEDELYSLKPSKLAARAIPRNTVAATRGDVYRAAREFAVRIGADGSTPGVLEEVNSFLKAPLPEGWRKFETADGACYYSQGDSEATQWEHPDEERLLAKLANVASFPGSPLWVWQQRRAIKPHRKKTSLVRAWKRRPMIKAELNEEADGETQVEVEILKSGFPKLNFKLLKVFCKYFSVLPEEASRVSFLLKIAAVCPLPPDVRLEMKEETCLFVGDTFYSTRHPCDNFFQVVFDGLVPDDLPATPLSKVGDLWFHWEKDDLVVSDKPYSRRSLSRAFLKVVDLIASRSAQLSSQTILEMAYQGVCVQNVSLVLTALGEVVAAVHDIGKRENTSTAHLSDRMALNDASWRAVHVAALKTLKSCEAFLSNTTSVVVPKSPRKHPPQSGHQNIKTTHATTSVVAFSMADSDEGEEAAEDDGEEENESEETSLDECPVTFGGLDKAMAEYPAGAHLFVPDLLDQLTLKELAGTVKFLESLVEAGNNELVKAMEERDDLNAELVELSNKINLCDFCVFSVCGKFLETGFPL